jgi:prolyl 4-hydroxylase
MKMCVLIGCAATVLGVNLSQYPETVMLAESPRIYWIEHFLSDEECAHLMRMATPYLKKSYVIDNATGGEMPHAERISDGAFLEYGFTDRVVHGIEKRIAAWSEVPVENGEALYVLRYGVGGEYRPHYDFFDAATVGGQEILKRGGQRVATCILYLDGPEEGGETIFPKAKVMVKPVKGSAVLFFNCNEEGEVDPMSLHGGAPVIRGTKWIATRWIRQNRFN